MRLYNLIKEYEPCNEQEERDRKSMLRYMETQADVLSRKNTIAHFTASAWILNKDHSKILMIHHNIYHSWSWTGGHADGEEDLCEAAIREAKEETGVMQVELLQHGIFSLEILTVEGHEKKGEYVPSHLHLNLTYLLEADENDILSVKEDENSGVRWFSPEGAVEASSEVWMRERIYSKLNQKCMDAGIFLGNLIINCEAEYIECFSHAKEHPEYVQYEDELLPDMYKHNFLAVRKSVAPHRIERLIGQALSEAKNKKKDFLRIEMLCGQEYPGAVKEHLGAYQYPLDEEPVWVTRNDCEIKKIETPVMVEQLAELDLAHDRVRCGEDFCLRRARRRGQVYMSEKSCDSYLCYQNGIPVGNCDLFLSGDTAKIEDFAVLPDFQHQGIGTTLLYSMISTAKTAGAKIIYLCADEEDSPREMYLKLGFRKVMDFYALFWKF